MGTATVNRNFYLLSRYFKTQQPHSLLEQRCMVPGHSQHLPKSRRGICDHTSQSPFSLSELAECHRIIYQGKTTHCHPSGHVQPKPAVPRLSPLPSSFAQGAKKKTTTSLREVCRGYLKITSLLNPCGYSDG